MSPTTNPDVDLVQKIYRRLQDTTFDTGVFSNERLVFLSFPQPHWRLAGELVWTDAGELFDNEFGYVEKTYGNQNQSELRRFFSDKLKVAERPKLEQYARAWQTLCAATPVDRPTVERKLKTILTQMADSQDELSTCNWWLALKPNLKIWATAGRFVSPATVYMPDDALAVEIFKDQAAGEVPIAYLPKSTKQGFAFLEHMGCKSLAENIQPSLLHRHEETPDGKGKFLTDAAKELVVLMICSEHGLQDHADNLQRLLQTNEVSVETITVNYSLRGNSAAGVQPRPNDAYWDNLHHCLLLCASVDDDTLREAAAKSIAAQFSDKSGGADRQVEFFRLLIATLLRATPARAQIIKRQHPKWNLTTEQEAWLREQDWQPVLIELEVPEQPQPNRQSPLLFIPNRVQPPTPSDVVLFNPQTTPTTTPELADVARVEPNSVAQERSSEPAPNSQSPGLHDANTTEAEVVSVRGHTRARQPRRPNREQAVNQQATPEPSSGLAATSAQDKAALEKCAREYATKELKKLGYEVKPMETSNPGYDLKATKPGELLKVEVKGHSSESQTVFVTQREWEEHMWTDGVENQSWELWDFQNLSKASGKKPTFRRIRHIPKSAKRESGYWIDLSQCSSDPIASE